MTSNWRPKLESTIRSMIGAPAQPAVRDVSNFRPTGQPVRNFEKHDPAADRLLPVRDIARALWRYSNDPEMRGEWRRVPIEAVAAVAQLSRPTIYEARRGRMSEKIRAILSRIIPQIEKDEIRFRRVGRQWEVEYRRPPAVLSVPQDKLTRGEDHRDWAPCRNCRGLKWTAVMMNGARWHACNNCLPPPQWAGMGIHPVQRSRSDNRQATPVTRSSRKR